MVTKSQTDKASQKKVGKKGFLQIWPFFFLYWYPVDYDDEAAAFYLFFLSKKKINTYFIISIYIFSLFYDGRIDAVVAVVACPKGVPCLVCPATLSKPL